MARDFGGLLMVDPLDIRYATDTTNMQVWTTPDPFPSCLLCAEGSMVPGANRDAPFLAEQAPLVPEVRSGASMFCFVTGDDSAAVAARRRTPGSTCSRARS